MSIKSTAAIIFIFIFIFLFLLAACLCCYYQFRSKLWTEHEFYSNGKYVLFYPEPNLILIFSVNKLKYPADWEIFQPSTGTGFRVSGVGPSNAHDATYGILYYSSRYSWLKNTMKYSVLSRDFQIVRGEYLICQGKKFHIYDGNPTSPKIIVMGDDGSATEVADIPNEIIPGLVSFMPQYAALVHDVSSPDPNPPESDPISGENLESEQVDANEPIDEPI